MTVLRVSVVLIGCLFAALAPSPRAAAQATREPAGFRAVIDEAVAEYEARNFEESRALFAKAHAMFPNARTLRGLGMVEFELRNYGRSIEHLEAALASPVRPLDGKLREHTEQLLSRARGFVAHVHLDVQPQSSRVIVDDVPIEVPSGQALVLTVGDHVLEVQAEGYLPEKRALSLKGGESQTIRIAMREPPRPVAPSSAHPTTMQRVGPWLVVGTSGALLVGGGVLLGLGFKDRSEVEHAKKGVRWSEIEGPYERGPVLTTTGFVLGGVGLLGVTAGLLWKYVWSEEKEPPRVNVGASASSLHVFGNF